MMTLPFKPGSDFEKRILQELESRIKMSKELWKDRHQKWQEAEDEILAYVPETAADATRANRRANGEPQYTTIKIPYSYALLMAAHTYMSSVFLSRTPVHQFSGDHGETARQVTALEALISYQTIVGEHLAPYYLWLYDMGKYGVGILQEYWGKEVHEYAQLVADESGKVQVASQVLEGYEGNKVRNVDPYRFFPDPRHTFGDFQQGEFVGVLVDIAHHKLVKRAAQGYYVGVERMKNRRSEDQQDQETSSQLPRPGTTKHHLGRDKVPAKHRIFEVYVELIPKDWQLGPGQYPQKWVFTCDEDFEVLLGATPMGYMHCKFPFNVGEVEIEKYGLWNRGIPEIVSGLQDSMDWLFNSHMTNVRACINNQFIFDPTKVVVKDLQKGGPGLMVRIKPAAVGQPIDSYFKQLQVVDITRNHMNDLQSLFEIGERIMGINEQMLGGLAGSGRKTATEIRTSTGFGVNRLKTICEYISVTAFGPHSRKLVANSQQLFSAEKKLRVAGNLVQEAGPEFIDVSPEMIAGSFSPTAVDGTQPIDKFAMANLWKEILMGMQTMPALLARYDVGRIFEWMVQLAGVRNLEQFKIQVEDPGTLAQQAQLGNLIAAPKAEGGPPQAGGQSSRDAGLDTLLGDV